jgi:NADPH-dependent glutamate synthase beta subunit-like oxidoreductase
VTLFEGKSQLGGMLRYGIPSYRLPHSILDRDIERILALGIQVQQGMKVGKEISWKDLKSFDAIFLASGMQSGKMLSIFEDCKGSVVTGLEFLTGPQRSFIAGLRQRTLIIGGGNVAIDVARTLIRLHQGKDTHITLICPESREQMPALPEEISEALEEGVTIIDGWAPHKLHKKSGKISSLDFFKAKVTKDDHSGVLQITRVGKIIQKFKVDSAILAIGQELDASSLPEGIEVRGGKVVTDQFGRTSLPRFFAGGDLIGRNAFVVDAIASGKTGALAIASFLEEKDVEKEFENHRIGTSRAISFHHFAEPSYRDSIDLKRVVSFEQMNTLFFLNAARNQQEKINPTVRKEAFKEVTRGLKPRSMEEETARCFKCGTCVDCESCIDFCPDISIFKEGTSLDYRLDEDHCKGCGACSVACPRHVIEMVPETI